MVLGEPTALGGIFFLFVLPALFGAIIGVVVTAIASAATTPTRASFISNLLLGAAGYVLGFFIGMARAHLLPGDFGIISSTALAGAFFASGAHEVERWMRQPR